MLLLQSRMDAEISREQHGNCGSSRLESQYKAGMYFPDPSEKELLHF
jgi:hypothetical protein